MTDQTTPAGAPAGTPAGSTPGTSRSFLERRVPVMAAEMERHRERQSAQGEQSGADVRQQQQQTPPGERTVDQELAELRAFRAEQDVRKNSLPKTEAEYLAKNSDAFKLPPDAAPYAFNEQDPALAAARRFALAKNLNQQDFSEMLDLFVSTQAPSMKQQQAQLAHLREANMAQLGTAAHLRVDAVANWTAASVPGDDGRAFANFIRQNPAAPIVRAMETLIKKSSGQRAAADSQQRRESESANADTRIPGYDKMTFQQIRAHQMGQMLSRPAYRGGGPRRGE